MPGVTTTVFRVCAECGAVNQVGACKCGASQVCRTCRKLYNPGGDGFNGECPSCAERADERTMARDYD